LTPVKECNVDGIDIRPTFSSNLGLSLLTAHLSFIKENSCATKKGWKN
jgi:hypothetical protein